MAMDQSILKSFLSERVGEVKRAGSVISDAILDKDDDGGGGGRARSQQASAGAASGTSTTVGARQEPPPEGAPGSEPEGEDAGGPSRFLSQRTRQAVDGVLRDPDVERLAGRARGFARERLLQAEAAARVLKGEEGGGRGGASPRLGDGREQGRGVKIESAGESTGVGVSDDDPETPIISGLVSEASGFVAGRVGQAREGVKEVVEAAVDVRRSRHTAAAAAAAKRPGKDGAVGGGGDDVEGTGNAGEEGKTGVTRR